MIAVAEALELDRIDALNARQRLDGCDDRAQRDLAAEREVVGMEEAAGARRRNAAAERLEDRALHLTAVVMRQHAHAKRKFDRDVLRGVNPEVVADPADRKSVV